MRDSIWFLYIIQAGDLSLYSGITTDVARRMDEHAGNSGKGAKYLRGRGPLKLLLELQVGTKSDALKLECKVKKLSRQQKFAFIEHPEQRDNWT